MNKYKQSIADKMLERRLAGMGAVLIDEWQLAPKLWDAIRFEVDRKQNTTTTV